LPETGAIDPTPPEEGAWVFPVGALFIKHFDFQTNAGLRPLETRFLIQEADGVRGFTYRWNEAGTDATLVTAPATAPIADGPLTWHYPGPTECTTCHRGRGVLGLDSYQLEPPEPLRARFSAPPVPASLHPLADAPIASRARAWLHVNCAYCHDGLGPSGTPLDLRRDVPLDAMAACDIPPVRGDLGLGPAARLIAPGSPDASVLWRRIASRAADGMPPLGTSRVDPEAALVSDWIAGLSTCR
jgi:hypothetical protein